MSERSEYIPGQCNIGAAERRQRTRAGWIGVLAAIVLEAIFILLRVRSGWRLFEFLPVALAASGFLQSAFHFCANFGMRGVFNFGADVGRTENVMQQEFRRKDRAKALLIISLSFIIGAVLALAAFLTGPR